MSEAAEAPMRATAQEPVGAQPPPRIPALLWLSCDGIMVIDAQRRLVAMNPTLERWTGRRAREVIGQTECGALLGCRSAGNVDLCACPSECPGLRAMRSGDPVASADYTIRAADGRRLAVNASYTPIRAGPHGGLWTLAILRDATASRRRERWLARRARTDALTGLPNRAAFLAACRSELRRSERERRPLALAMADVDGLKAFNDAEGHLAGDALLRELARILAAGHRAGEVVARYGGDEFGIVLPNTDAAAALVVAERLRQRVEGFPFARQERTTVSIGLALRPEDGASAEELLAKADARLYEAKRAGGNRIVGPDAVGERRRRPRFSAGVPVEVRRMSDPVEAHTKFGTLRDLSLGGAYLSVPGWAAVSLDDCLLLALDVPAEHRAHFPGPRLAACARVVRVNEPSASPDAESPAGLGLGVEFVDL